MNLPNIKNKRKEEIKMLESLVRVDTSNLINKKEISIINALLNIQIKDR